VDLIFRNPAPDGLVMKRGCPGFQISDVARLPPRPGFSGDRSSAPVMIPERHRDKGNMPSPALLEYFPRWKLERGLAKDRSLSGVHCTVVIPLAYSGKSECPSGYGRVCSDLDGSIFSGTTGADRCWVRRIGPKVIFGQTGATC